MHKNAMRRRRIAVGGEGLFFHRRCAPRGVAKGDERAGACLRHEQSLRQLAMLVATSLYTKEAFIRRECAGGVARGANVLFLLVQEKVPKEAR